MLLGLRSQKRRGNVRGLKWKGSWVRGPQHPQQESVFNTGIVLSDDVCYLMLIRYGGPKLQMDFVSFVHLMLRAEKMESELAGRREGQGFLCIAHGLSTCPQFKQEGGQLPVQKHQARELWGALATCLGN